MRSWLILLGGLLLWAVHFFLLYGIGEFGGSGPAARLAIGLISIACLAIITILLVRLARQPREDALSGWGAYLGRAGLLLGALGVVWQTLPVLLAQ
jgi:hypothetical protein